MKKTTLTKVLLIYIYILLTALMIRYNYYNFIIWNKWGHIYNVTFIIGYPFVYNYFCSFDNKKLRFSDFMPLLSGFLITSILVLYDFQVHDPALGTFHLYNSFKLDSYPLILGIIVSILFIVIRIMRKHINKNVA